VVVAKLGRQCVLGFMTKLEEVGVIPIWDSYVVVVDGSLFAVPNWWFTFAVSLTL